MRRKFFSHEMELKESPQETPVVRKVHQLGLWVKLRNGCGGTIESWALLCWTSLSSMTNLAEPQFLCWEGRTKAVCCGCPDSLSRLWQRQGYCPRGSPLPSGRPYTEDLCSPSLSFVAGTDVIWWERLGSPQLNSKYVHVAAIFKDWPLFTVEFFLVLL